MHAAHYTDNYGKCLHSSECFVEIILKLEMQILCSSGKNDNWTKTTNFLFTNFLGRINQSDNVESIIWCKKPIKFFISIAN